MDLYKHPHRRFNPLTLEWVLVSPHRTDRPWKGQFQTITVSAATAYDPDCYLCPGNRRHSGECNPYYDSTFVFDNDFPALLPDTPKTRFENDGLMIAESERGLCRVMCFSPDHSLTLGRMGVGQIRKVVDTLTAQYRELSSRPGIRQVQIFENRGAMMGCSNPHPHCQIWANETIPTEVAKEIAAMSDHRASRGTCMLCDYATLEGKLGERTVCRNESFIAVVPFWAVWPFEMLIVSRRHSLSLEMLADAERSHLAEIMQRIAAGYDSLFDVPFPYTMGFHQFAPGDNGHFHGHYYPPLLRSATVRKFMVGYEMLAMPQRDLSPESAAQHLRAAHARVTGANRDGCIGDVVE